MSNWVFVLLVGSFCYGTIALALTFFYRYIILCDSAIQRIVFSKKVILTVASKLFTIEHFLMRELQY